MPNNRVNKFLTNIGLVQQWIFDQKNGFLTKKLIFDQKMDFWLKKGFWPKNGFLTKKLSFDQKMDFWPKNGFLTKKWIFDQYILLYDICYVGWKFRKSQLCCSLRSLSYNEIPYFISILIPISISIIKRNYFLKKNN